MGNLHKLADNFKTLLEAVAVKPDSPIGQLPLLTEGERHQLLIEWNDTHADYPRDKCIHEAFVESAKKSPEAIAVVYENRRLSYGDLNERSNQLAHYLRRIGVEPETLVGVLMERSPETIVGLLGILKAGAHMFRWIRPIRENDWHTCSKMPVSKFY